MRIWLAWLLVLLAAVAQARTALPSADDPLLEARMLRIAAELRCLVCQNQTIADSQSGLAQDLREEVRGLLRGGSSEDQVRRYMTARYGDFVLYRPPLKASTVLLWAGPGLLLGAGMLALVATLRRRSRLAPEAFDDEDEAGPEPLR